MAKPALSNAIFEPEHVFVVATQLTLAVVVFLFFWLILSPGLSFWSELIEVVPFMLMGGLCSPEMMVKMMASVTNAGILLGAFALLRWGWLRAKEGFGGSAHLLRLPLASRTETVWQNRLSKLRIERSLWKSVGWCAALVFAKR